MVNECCCVISKPRRFGNDRQYVIGIGMFIEFQELYIHISKDVNFVCWD